MSEPFLAEVRIFGFNFPPRGWAFCDGQILPISQNESLFSLLGTTYGGDGRTSFGLPELRGRTPIHVGQSNGGANHNLGQKGGEESVLLNIAEIPAHTHVARASSDPGTQPVPADAVLADSTSQAYTDPENLVDMNAAELTNAGAGQQHNTMQPCLALSFCIALQGLFPSRN